MVSAAEARRGGSWWWVSLGGTKPRQLPPGLESFILEGLQSERFQRSALCAPVAQLDRATGYEPVGRAFESLRAHHFKFNEFNQLPPSWLEHLVSVHLRCSRF